MTMHDPFHPDDERLAAYAGGDRDAITDRELVSHLATCDRCGPLLAELTLLRDALALLPDVPPSRPLRLIPPVPTPATHPARGLEWLRRLAAPAMAAGAGLVLIGAAGASGVITDLRTRDTSAQEAAAASDRRLGPLAGGGDRSTPAVPGTVGSPALDSLSTPGTTFSGSGSSHVPDSKGAAGPPQTLSTGSDQQPWLTVLVAGFALFGISASLRYTLNPRAG